MHEALGTGAGWVESGQRRKDGGAGVGAVMEAVVPTGGAVAVRYR